MSSSLSCDVCFEQFTGGSRLERLGWLLIIILAQSSFMY